MASSLSSGSNPKVSCIIPCYRCRRTLGFVLKSLSDQTTSFPFEVIVVDSSPNGVSDWIKTKYRAVKVVQSEERLFPGSARNRGAQVASAPTLAFLDADARPSENWLETLHRKLYADREAALVGGAVMNANPESFGSRVQYWLEFSEFTPGSGSGFRDFLSSSNFVVRRDDFFETGGFSTHFEMAEDILFAQRFQNRVYFESSVGIFHYHRTRWKQVVEHLYNLGYWSGKLRGQIRLSGSSLRRFPVTALLLPFYRLPRVLSRIWKQEGAREGLQVLVHSPFLLMALLHWARGFHRGLGDSPSNQALTESS